MFNQQSKPFFLSTTAFKDLKEKGYDGNLCRKISLHFVGDHFQQYFCYIVELLVSGLGCLQKHSNFDPDVITIVNIMYASHQLVVVIGR